MRTFLAVPITAVAVTWLLVVPCRGHAGSAAAQPSRHASLPEFSLDMAGGGALSVRRDHGHLLITDGKVSVEPRALVVHFFQPDCLQCQSEAKALQAIHQKYDGKGVRVIGIAHREDARAARAFAERLGVSYPLLLGTGSQVSKQLAAGDTLYITDDRGSIRFSQPGYGTGDESLWKENIDLLLAGKQVARATTEREKLRIGDRLPTVKLKSLMTGEEMSLTGKDGHLTFTDATGTSVRPRAAIGLFARYCAFTREEMVHLQQFHEKYRKDGLLVFTIALHPSPEVAKAVTRELGLTYPVFEGHGSDLEKQYGFG
jgi:peroxiredoxin